MVNHIYGDVHAAGRTFGEFVLLPGLTPANCSIQSVRLDTNLSGLELKLPMMTAAMTSVTGYDMALAAAKEGAIGVLPNKLSIDEQVNIVKRVKGHEMTFVEDPIYIRVNRHPTMDYALRLVKRFGHSTIPVVDRDNVFLGMFILQDYLDMIGVNPQSKIEDVMKKKEDATYCVNTDISVTDANRLREEKKADYLVVLDTMGRLRKMIFSKDVEKLKIASAISTHKGWQERVEANVSAGVDMIVIDTSDAYSQFTADVLKEYRAMKTKVPICAGNIVTFGGAKFLMENGADIVKVGMSSGSICTTQREKAVGRAPMTALIKADMARMGYLKRSNRYVPLVMDGGISSSADMILALTIADAVMMGGYFNKFFEAEGGKLNANREPTNIEDEIRFVETWGEGSLKAQNLDRYGQSKSTFFPEGIEGVVPYAGRLKSGLKHDVRKVKAALVNVGVNDLEQFRKKANLELVSLSGKEIVGAAHHVNT